MSWSNKLFPRDPGEFPTPPVWLAWVGRTSMEQRIDGIVDRGVVRHFADFKKARRFVGHYASPYTKGVWHESWSIYRWDDEAQKYVEKYSARQGEPKNDHPLFHRKVAGETAAIKSIMKALEKR